MSRRKFLSVGGASIFSAAALVNCDSIKKRHLRFSSGIAWHRNETTRLFDGIAWNGRPLIHDEGVGLMDGFCRRIEDDNLGLTRLPESIKRQIIRDIESLIKG